MHRADLIVSKVVNLKIIKLEVLKHIKKNYKNIISASFLCCFKFKCTGFFVGV